MLITANALMTIAVALRLGTLSKGIVERLGVRFPDDRLVNGARGSGRSAIGITDSQHIYLALGDSGN